MSKAHLLSKLIIPCLLIGVYLTVLVRTISATDEGGMNAADKQARELDKSLRVAVKGVSLPDAQSNPALSSVAKIADNQSVLGVSIGEAARAYLLDSLSPGSWAVNDSLGGVPLVIFIDANQASGRVFQARLNGKLLEFSGDGKLITDSGGSTWNLSGKAVRGPSAGMQLVEQPASLTTWRAWLEQYPATSVYTP